MRSLPLVVHLLAAGVVMEALLAPEVAYAQAPATFEGTGLVEMIAPTGIVGDGATPAELYVVALGPTGAPLTGLALKASVTTGSVSAMTDAGGGLWKLTFTPPKADAKVAATLTLKGKIGKDTYQKSFNFTVSPPKSRQLSAAANPPKMTLGSDRTATLSFNLAGGDRQNLGGIELAFLASSGTVENVTNLGGGQFTALFTSPSVNYPHVAIVTVVDKRDPSRTFGAIPIPMWGKVDFPVTAAPNSKVIIKIGDQQFGPVPADAQGRARVPIMVSPGAQVAEKISVSSDGQSTSEPLDLKVPEGKRVALMPLPAAIPSDSRLAVPVHLYVATPDGKPDTAAQVVFTVTAGTISTARHVGNGVYEGVYTPPNGASSAQATLSASLTDRPQAQTASLPINLVGTRPANVSLTAEPTLLPAAAEGFKVFAKVNAPDGSGIGGRTVTFGASGARVKGDVKDLKNGDYQGLFTTTGSGPVELTATVSTPTTGNPMSRVLLVPSRSRVNNDGLSSSMVTVVSVDEFGYPVPNVAVNLKLTQGDGALPATATTGADGLAQVHYTAGRKAGIVSIEAQSGDAVSAVSLAQVPDELALAGLPIAGSRVEAALVNEWGAALGELRIEREGMQGAVIAPMVPTLAGGVKAAKAAMSSDPASVSAGGSVRLRINLTDDQGRGVPGQKLDFLTSVGSVGTVTEIGGGVYETTLAVPSTAGGDVKVSVATIDGSVSAFMRVPVGGAESAWSTESPFATQATVDPYATPAPAPAPTPAPAPAPAPAPTTTTTTTVSKAPAAPSDRPFLRARVGFTFGYYSYDQLPLSKTTVLFPKELILDSGSQGGAVQARFFIPGVPYVGLEGAFRGTVYSVDPKPLCAALENECADAALVYDTVLNQHVVAIGRYPFDVGASTFHVGGRVGWGNSDVQTYTVKEGQEILLDQLALNSLSVGAELGAEIGPSLFLATTFNEQLAGGSTPFNTEFQFEVGYAFLPFMYASLAYDMSLRQIGIENRDGDAVGEITDTFHGGTASVGVQF